MLLRKRRHQGHALEVDVVTEPAELRAAMAALHTIIAFLSSVSCKGKVDVEEEGTKMRLEMPRLLST